MPATVQTLKSAEPDPQHEAIPVARDPTLPLLPRLEVAPEVFREYVVRPWQILLEGYQMGPDEGEEAIQDLHVQVADTEGIRVAC